MEMREFDKNDWYGFAGATGWGKELPLATNGTLPDGTTYVMVLDSTGGCLMFSDEETVNECGGRPLDCPFPTQHAARVFAWGMGEPKGKLDFLAVGFC